MRKHYSLLLRLLVAFILIQTLRFKFTAHPDSVYIFEKVGLEPFGRIGIGILELFAGIMLLVRKTVWTGAILTIGIIGGAIYMHLTLLGIEINGDHGILFFTALLTLTLSVVVLYMHRKELPFVKKRS